MQVYNFFWYNLVYNTFYDFYDYLYWLIWPRSEFGRLTGYNFSLFIAKLTWTCLRIYPNWWIAILLLIFLLESNIPLTTYEDFLELSVKQLTDYLSVRGLNTSGRKVELIARAFAAMELKLDIIQSSESQSNLLQHLQYF